MNQGILTFNQVMIDYLIKNKRYLLSRPAYARAFKRISSHIKKQEKVREHYALRENLTVPPVLIMSVTNDCNLKCKGCYACSQQRDRSEEMGIEDIYRTVDEAVALGVSVILIAGGEPLMKQGILDLPEMHPKTLFVMFTNGLLLQDDMLHRVTDMKNLIPIISIEGNEAMTDRRRGKGIYRAVLRVMQRLNEKRSLFGASITITSENYDEVVHADYLSDLEAKGCRVVFLIEYVPTKDDFDLCLTAQQKAHLDSATDALMAQHNMLIVPLPGDEDKYGGCLAAGRGFIHISSTGSLEACPFAPYSDTNIKDTSFKNALSSRLLREIRDNHHLLNESRGGCALHENRAWVESLMDAQD